MSRSWISRSREVECLKMVRDVRWESASRFLQSSSRPSNAIVFQCVPTSYANNDIRIGQSGTFSQNVCEIFFDSFHRPSRSDLFGDVNAKFFWIILFFALPIVWCSSVWYSPCVRLFATLSSGRRFYFLLLALATSVCSWWLVSRRLLQQTVQCNAHRQQ